MFWYILAVFEIKINMFRYIYRLVLTYHVEYEQNIRKFGRFMKL